MDNRNLIRVGLVVLWAILFVAYVFTHSGILLIASVAVIVLQVVVGATLRR